MTITAVSGGHEFVYQTDGSKKWISEDKLKRTQQKKVLYRLVLAFAVNFGIIDIGTLFCSTYDSHAEDVGHFAGRTCKDENTPDMKEISCFSTEGRPLVCFVISELHLFYPVLTTSKYPNTHNSPCRACSCPQDAKNEDCSDGRFVQLDLGEILELAGTAEAMRKGWRMQQIMLQDAVNGRHRVRSLISGLGYTASYLRSKNITSNADWSQDGVAVDGEVDGMTYEQFAADFTILGENLTVVSVPLNYLDTIADINNQGLTLDVLATHLFNKTDIDDNAILGHNLNAIMCENVIDYPEALEFMSQKPPVNVVQPYLTCRPTLSNALFTAAAIAAANAALISFEFLSGALFLIIHYTNDFKGDKLLSPARKAALAAEKDSHEKNELREKCEVLSRKCEEIDELKRFILQITPPGVPIPSFLSHSSRHFDHVPSPTRTQESFIVENPMVRISGSD